MKCPIGTVNFWNGKRKRENEMKETKDSLLEKKHVGNRLSLSLRTVDRLVASGELEKVKVRGAVRFRESDVEALIERGCK